MLQMLQMLQLLLLLLLLSGSDVLCLSIRIAVTIPQDPIFQKYRFANFQIQNWPTINSLTTANNEFLFHLEKAEQIGSGTDRISFNGSISQGSHNLGVNRIVNGVTESLNISLSVNVVPVNAIYQSVYAEGQPEKLRQLISLIESSNAVSKVVVTSFSDNMTAYMTYKGDQLMSMAEMWKLTSEIIQNNTQLQDLILLPNSCNTEQFCQTELQFRNNSMISSLSATITTNASVNHYLAFDLIRSAVTAGINNGNCDKYGCLNGAACINSKCECPKRKNQASGPRCEGTLRSFTTQIASPITTHWIGPVVVSRNSMTLSLEFAGYVEDSVFLSMKQNLSSPSSLITIIQRRSDSSLSIEGDLVQSPLNFNETSTGVSSGEWLSLSTIFTDSQVTAVLCHHRPAAEDECQSLNHSRVTTASFTAVRNGVIELGSSFRGCVRNFKVNGHVIDLHSTIRISNSSLTTENCELQDKSCAMSDSLQYVCGNNSLCYGAINVESTSVDCRCRCFTGTRRKMEYFSDRCSQKPNRDTMCSDTAAAVINSLNTGNVSGSSSMALSRTEWHLNGTGAIPLENTDVFYLSFEIRTRQMEAGDVLSGKLNSNIDVSVKISKGHLQFCSSSNCYNQNSITVSDGSWHRVEIQLMRSLLTQTVDGLSSMHQLVTTMPRFTDFVLGSAISFSCVRNIKASSIYLSLNDVTSQSLDRTQQLNLTLGQAATTNAVCQDPTASQACSCTPGNRSCIREWGSIKCICPEGSVLSGDNCIPVNPCQAYSIRCPGAATCVALNGADFECRLNPGVTVAPLTTASLYWLPYVIAALVLLLLLLLLLLFAMYRNGVIGGAIVVGDNNQYSDIDVLHQNLNEEDPYSGAPPEDYKGNLPIQIAPIAAAAPQKLNLANPMLGNVNAFQPLPAPKEGDFDETLNYGYEDNESDEDLDLDRVSLVSTDSDSDLQLQEKLNSWGPKFAGLSDLIG